MYNIMLEHTESVWFQQHLTLRSLSRVVFSFAVIILFQVSEGNIDRLRISSVTFADGVCNTVVDILQRWCAEANLASYTTSRKLDRWRGTVGVTRVHCGKGGRYRCYRAQSAIVLSTQHYYVFYSGEWNFAMRTYI